MRLSMAAHDFASTPGEVHFLPKGGISAFVRELGLYPEDGRVSAVPAEKIHGVLRAQSMEEIEARVNRLAIELKSQHVPENETLRQAIDLATNTNDPFELQYMTAMFLHQRAVVRALARNPNLPERTQNQLAQDAILVKDRETMLSLAHNPALTVRVMRSLLHNSTDAFVWQGVARNAAYQAKKAAAPSEFARLCEELSGTFDYAVSTAVIPGITNGDMLRSLYEQNNALLSPDRLEMIAQNPNTPEDVLEKMSQGPFAGLQRAVGLSFPEQARLTLATRRQEARASANAAPSLGM